MEPSHRSIIPNIPGVPWWGAVLIATIATLVGYLIDSGNKELTHTFAGLYIAGCLAAVLAVRQSGVFTAVIQPPLILFCAVPGAYWMFHGGKVDKFKDLLINCGYPLIERFPLMLGTAGGVLLIGLVRWYFGMSQRTSGDTTATSEPSTEWTSVLSGLIAKLNGLLAREPDDTEDEATGQPAHAIGRTSRTSRTSRSSRNAERPTRTRSRHARPTLDGQEEPTADRQRQQRRQQGRRYAPPPRDHDAAEPPRRARRPRPPSDPDLRAQPPREMRRDPHARRSPYERPAPRSSRFDPYDVYEPPEQPRPTESSTDRRYGPSYEPYEPYEPPRRRATPPGPNNSNPTHHPISQVRYRGSAPRSEPRTERQEPRAERRSRSRAPRNPPAESWEYDV